MHFLFDWAQTWQDGRTLYSKKSYVFCFSILTFFGGKMTFQGMAKQINNFERTWRDRNKCENIFSKPQSVGELLSFDFWISRHFVTIFRNIGTFQDAISRKPIEIFQKFFHICFYHVTFFQNCLFLLPYLEILILLSILWCHFPAKNR